MLKLLKRAKRLFKKINFFLNSAFRRLFSEKIDLLIYDDIYPHPISGFRFEEFTILLKEFKKSKIIVNPTAYGIIGTPVSEHKKHIFNIIQQHPELKHKLIHNTKNIDNAKIFYCVFLSNILKNLSWLEKHNIPFVFTLYPGGGFEVNDEESDARLKKIFKSSSFHKVIVTQDYTRKYLLEKKFCEESDMTFIFGCVVPQKNIGVSTNNKLTYLLNKNTFDICFCAAKYTNNRKDKGYNVFIDFAHNLSKKFDLVRFHVIGGYDKNDIDIRLIEEKIKFYGYQDFEDLKKIFLYIDVIVSPNKPYVINKGAFDGFPLGTVIEAALNGVVAIVSDPLKQNNVFIDKQELIIINAEISSIEKEVISLIENPELLYSISEKGQKKFSEVYSNVVQMNPRIELLRNKILNYD